MKVAAAILLALVLAAPAAAEDTASFSYNGGDVVVTGLPGKANTLVAVASGGSVFFGDQAGTLRADDPGLCTESTQNGIAGRLCAPVIADVNSVRLDGGDANDTLLANPGVASTLNGDPGDDTLVGGPDPDTFTGGDGTDTVAYVAPDGAGIDRSAAVTATLPEPGAAPTTANGATGENDSIAGDVEGLVGGQGDDTLTGNGAANTLAGAAPPGTPGVTSSPAGTDTITGAGGDDTLLAGDRGTVAGGEGNDQLVGGRDTAATTTVTGGPGDDTLVSGRGDDDLSGGDGADTLAYASVPLAGLDRGTSIGVTVTLPETGATGAGGTTGGEEQDAVHDDIETLAGANGPDVLTGSSRADTIAGAVPPGTPGVTSTPAGADIVTGAGGADTLVAGDTGMVRGGDGDDTLVGGAGATELFGDAGADRLVSGTGNDTVHGGDGNDFLVYAAVALIGLKRDAGVTAALAGATPTTGNGAAGENDTIFGDVESLVGGNGNDTLTGNAGPNTILGVAPAGTPGLTPGPPGNDTLDGVEGDDVLVGAGGSDTITGGAGTDAVSAGAGDDRVFVRDGAAEAPVCGDGADTAEVDALDTPAADCETVQKPGATPSGDQEKPFITVTPRRVRLLTKRRIRLGVRCRNEPDGCRLTIRVAGVKRTVATKGTGRRRTVLRLSRRTVRRIQRRGKLVLRVRVTARDASGNQATKTVRVTVRRRS